MSGGSEAGNISRQRGGASTFITWALRLLGGSTLFPLPSSFLWLSGSLGSSPSPTPILVQWPDQLRACGWWGQPGGGSVVWWTAPGGAGEKGQLLCPVRCASNRGTSRGRLTSSGPFKCEGAGAVKDSRESRCRDPEG